jgi:hypothetical protein
VTAAWSEQLPDRSADDRKAWLQFGLALVGGAAVLGSLFGGAYGFVRSASCWCCQNEELR